MSEAAPSPAAPDSAIVRIVSGIAEIKREEWDAVANPGWPSDRPLQSAAAPGRQAYNPFLSHDFLRSLEDSGAATPATGWAPRHLLLDGTDGIAGAMPLYLKNHSMGEYVFDHGWAEALAGAGGRYYPKLQGSVPFTPVTGRRLLVRPGPESDQRRRVLATAAVELARRDKLSSVHITFMPAAEWELVASLGYLKRTDQQYQFVNEGYSNFEAFLGALASRKRKAIRRERREAVAEGVEIHHLTGGDITESAWDAFFAFYMDTGSRKWGRPYLNRRFFSLIGERMADRILLVLAHRGGKAIAGALNFIGSDALFGRYWGAAEHRPFLHFEVCYYQAIEWSIAHGLPRVEAGAQGEHKLARGYVPALTYSAHWIADPGLRAAVADCLERERAQNALMADALSEHAPFRR